MTPPLPPSWVSKRDGRIVPFEPDRICRALFSATEELGRPDAFLARELADSAVHFIAEECLGHTPSTAEVAAIVVKVLRVLGHSELADAFLTPRRLSTAERLAEARSGASLRGVYTRDLAAAQDVGMLTLPVFREDLAAQVITPDALHRSNRGVGLVALDGLDHAPGLGIDVETLRHGLENAANLVVNLNSATPPSWADPLAGGPLFASSLSLPDRAARGDALLETLLALEAPSLRIDWHVTESDFVDEGRVRTLRVIERALAGAPIGWVFDRPRQPIALAEGLARGQPAVLLAVGVHLPVLARQRGLLADVERFCTALGSLARLALSAGVQMRDHLRRQRPDLTHGFLLDRARLVVVPVGLDETVNLFTDWSLCNGGPSLALGRRILSRFEEVLRLERRSSQLDACLDGPRTFSLGTTPPSRAEVAGLTPWAADASVSAQLRAGGALHGVAGHGTVALFLPTGATAEQVADWLAFAWQRTDIVRLCLLPGQRLPAPPRPVA